MTRVYFLLVCVCQVQDLRRGTQGTSFLSFLVLIVITPRIATDLNLHQVSTTQPQTERQEREMLNRARVWMICFNIDRSAATQCGKPSTIKEDYITRHSADWYEQSRFRDKVCSDISFCFGGADHCGPVLRRYLLRPQFADRFEQGLDPSFMSISRLDWYCSVSTSFRVTSEHYRHLTNYLEEWTRRFNEESDPGGMISFQKRWSNACSFLLRIVGRFHDDMFPNSNSSTGLNKVWTLPSCLFRD
jgi:hypothetical protein